MTQLELFAGIGGFGLAGEWAGIETIAQVEINPFCQKVLAKNFPHAKRYGDIREFDGTKYRGAIDIISGGFPCQPFSTAGQRKGTDDERYLWPEMLRVIREVQPKWVVGENVRGFVNWSGGLVFEQVCADLESSGYEVQPFLLPAASCNAVHFRERVWVIAYSNKINESRASRKHEREQDFEAKRQRLRSESCNYGSELDDSNPNKKQCKKRASKYNKQDTSKNTTGVDNRPSRYGYAWDAPQAGRSAIECRIGGFPTQPPVCGRNDGIPDRLDRIAALGNAIVPQVAYQIFKSIVQYEHVATQSVK